LTFSAKISLRRCQLRTHRYGIFAAAHARRRPQIFDMLADGRLKLIAAAFAARHSYAALGKVRHHARCDRKQLCKSGGADLG
jgi:hypothetical protein